MDNTKETFKRMNLRDLSAFYLYGTDGMDDEKQNKQSYYDYLKKESDAIFDRIRTAYPEEEQHGEVFYELSQALTAYEQVFMEIGMKAGARLIYHLLLVDDPLGKEMFEEHNMN